MIYLKRILTHPLFIVCLFCAIVISGEQMGGFYIFYILLGLPHFVLHSILGTLGIICLLFSYFNKTMIVSFLRVFGAVVMFASLLYFFLQPNGSYNYNTFSEALPLGSLIVFGVLNTIFIITNISALLNNTSGKEHHIT